MKALISVNILAVLLFSQAAFAFTPPITPAKPVSEKVHGVSITDNYRWLEDKNSPEVKDWTNKQHQATLNYLNENSPALAGLKEEIRNYIDRDIEGPARLVKNRQFFTMKKKGDLQYKLYTRLNGKNILIFDPVKIDPSGKTAISDLQYTFNGDKAAVGVQTKGDEINTYYIINTMNGNNISSPVTGLRDFNWAKDGQHAYITAGTKEILEKQEPLKTYLHKIGAARSTDKFVIAPADAKNFASIYDSEYSDLTFVSEGDFYSNSLKIKKTGSNESPKLIYPNKGFQAYPYAVGNKIYFQTNHNAPNWKIMVTERSKPDFKNWKDFYPQKDTVLDGYEVTDRYVIVEDKKDLISRLTVYTPEGKKVRELKLPEIGNVSNLTYNRETKKLYVGLSSFTSPYKIYSLDQNNFDKWNLFYQARVPVDTSNIQAKIEFIPSRDGTKVPVFVIHKKGIKLDGNNPTLLYGYGGFNLGISPHYIGYYASFINRGGIYVDAGIRGGDEYGENWHRNGMLMKKQNTFDDFIATAEYLVKNKYTNPQKLAIMGGSNGGLLIGATLTQRPDLFRAAVCSVPLLDMVRFHKFLIARYWIPEYGDPDKDADFRNILSYSPYHNIRTGLNIPVTLVKAGENDTRVDPLHAKKFVAALQNNPGQVSPVMLYMDFDSGHGSGKSTEQIIEDEDHVWRFIMNELGMNKK